MKLKLPTDFLILEYLSENGRNVASNVAIGIDRKRSYINVQLPYLEDYGLVEKIGSSQNSGLYEITEKGEAVLEHREQYDEEGVDFDALVEQDLEG